NFCDDNCDFNWKTKNQNDGYKYTAPVGSFKPNGIGLYDMTGNVWEWVSDWYDKNYYRNSPKDNPIGPASGKYKVLRGGSWLYIPEYLRAAFRDRYKPDDRNFNYGFRIAQD
ncbi:MAG: SUMF1/EgtB/PvdO family nonheme iron enzyme, partial [Nitrospinota bacterium]|nr:SUMF1/EgtB/PvdO family nonheme iron enzyme [Nitrospinota bacterium]